MTLIRATMIIKGSAGIWVDHGEDGVSASFIILEQVQNIEKLYCLINNQLFTI